MTRPGAPCHTAWGYKRIMTVRDILVSERTTPKLALRHWAGWFALAAVWTGVIWTAVGR